MKIISKRTLLSNVYCIRQNIKNQKICAVIKANSYGHETREIVKILNKKVDYFAVSSLAEALEILSYVKKKLLILSPLSRNEIKVFFKQLKMLPLDKKIELTITSISDLNSLISGTNSHPFQLKLHLKLNCGFNRFGAKTITQVKKLLDEISKYKNLKLAGVFTHVSSSNAMKKECNKFLKILKLDCLAATRNNKLLVHIGGVKSVNAINFLSSKLNRRLMLRAGINIYGYEGEYFTNELKPVMKITSPVVSIQKLKKGETSGYNASFTAKQNSKIAVIKIGYADGFSRELKGITIYNPNSMSYYQVVAVCMDYIMIDITGSKNIRVGTKFEILGENNPASIYTKKLNTITYEVLCNFSKLRN